MQRRDFLRAAAGLAAAAPLVSTGCRSTQSARIIKPGEKQMIGSHAAGQETFNPLIDDAVGQLLSRHHSLPQQPPFQQVSTGPEMLPPARLRVCFVGVENCTAEE